MIQEYQIRILPEQAASEEGIKRYLAKEKGLDVRTLNQVSATNCGASSGSGSTTPPASA